MQLFRVWSLFVKTYYFSDFNLESSYFLKHEILPLTDIPLLEISISLKFEKDS
eukprot:TRINITY_DN4557_c0_g1_i1.p1 TRINITY_DN4557_c0_g1~~TRINITY_DN4557_c0_g1_i1.p1  ORF type:complete len:53 (-),score=2.96 TRINITY_DN4557_c0_g1_i1:132-290(-)